MLKIAYFGLPLGALLLAEDGHDLCYAGISLPRFTGMRRARARFGDRLHLRPNVTIASTQEALRQLAPDLIVSWFWTNKLPQEVLAIPPLGALGVHPSLLPRHRGPDPTAWAILLADEISGVTAHRLDADYDTGAILAQREVRIRPDWNAFDLAKALDRPGLSMLRDLAARLSRGETIPELVQDARFATLAPLLPEAMSEVCTSRPAIEVLRQIRAWAPSPGAVLWVRSTPVTLLRASVVAPPRELTLPGELALWNGEVLLRTLDAALRLDTAEVDGEALDLGRWEELLGA